MPFFLLSTFTFNGLILHIASCIRLLHLLGSTTSAQHAFLDDSNVLAFLDYFFVYDHEHLSLTLKHFRFSFSVSFCYFLNIPDISNAIYQSTTALLLSHLLETGGGKSPFAFTLTNFFTP